MEKYLSGQVPSMPMGPDKKYRRESASVVDEYFSTEKPPSTPYSVNINVILPDTTHLRTGLYRPAKPLAAFPQIKMEPGTGFAQPCSSTSGPTQTLPEFTSVFSMPQSVAASNIFVKQEMPSEIPLSSSLLYQLPSGHSGGEMTTMAHATCNTTAISTITGVTMSTSSSMLDSRHLPRPIRPGGQAKPFQPTSQGQGSFHLGGQFYPVPGVSLPPSPPNSQPGSPENQPELINTISPPPSYEAAFGLKLAQPGQIPPLSNSLGNLSQGHVIMQTPKYNRRNNPELEKRRIHHCDYPGRAPEIIWGLVVLRCMIEKPSCLSAKPLSVLYQQSRGRSHFQMNHKKGLEMRSGVVWLLELHPGFSPGPESLVHLLPGPIFICFPPSPIKRL